MLEVVVVNPAKQTSRRRKRPRTKELKCDDSEQAHWKAVTINRYTLHNSASKYTSNRRRGTSKFYSYA